MEGGHVMAKFKQDVEFGQAFDALVELVCTNRGKHSKRTIEVMKRDGRRWFSVSEEVGITSKQAHDGVYAELGAPRGKLLERNGKIDTRHHGGLRETKLGCRVECPKCPRRPYDFPGVKLYRGLDKAAELGVSSLDVSYL
jgi:hypothetical protein